MAITILCTVVILFAFSWPIHRSVGHDGRVSEIVRRPMSRNAKLAKIPLGVAGRAAVGFGRKLAGGDRKEINTEMNQKAAEQLFAVLGELKGGAMKFGQALSVMEAAVPEEFGEHY